MNMPKITNVYAILLILLGIIGFVVTGMEHKTALIPTFFGLVVMVVGILAQNPKNRKNSMHLAAALALLGFAATVRGVVNLITMLGGGVVERPGAAISQSIMGLLSLIFVLLCVKSFIEARRKQA